MQAALVQDCGRRFSMLHLQTAKPRCCIVGAAQLGCRTNLLPLWQLCRCKSGFHQMYADCMHVAMLQVRSRSRSAHTCATCSSCRR